MRVAFNTPDPQDLSTERTANAAVSADVKPTVPQQGSETSLSDTASLSALASRALQTAEVRQDKVENLRQQVSSGQYQIDAKAIAESMLSQPA
jgi:flagellar biosynthesis anti-sigma factor FlgM